MDNNRKKSEVLAPASSLEVLKTAVYYGADAVYIGGEAFGLRAKAKNFSLEEMREGVEFAHERGVKVYVTANILAHNADLAGVREYFEDLKSVGPDALIISDPGVFMIAREVLERTNGWNFFLLTEDIEFTADCIAHGEKIGYCEKAVFYDEITAGFSRFCRGCGKRRCARFKNSKAWSA